MVDANDIFWGFYEYVSRNPFTEVNAMTVDDFAAMRDLFIDANQTELSSTPSFTVAEFPDKSGGASSISAAASDAAANQAQYPLKHRAS